MAAALLAILSPSRLETAVWRAAPVAQAQAQVQLAHAGQPVRQADFGAAHPSPDARQVVDWIAASADNQRLPFLVVDKKAAMLYAFDANAHLRAASPVLLGVARGDDTVAGIGQRPLADVKPQERTTPAGRFLGERGHNGRQEDVVWVDYDAGVSIHRVLTTNPAEHRLARLASDSLEDKRISYGCINVPVVFYEAQVQPMFARQRAFVYVLPEVKSVAQVFTTMSTVAMR
ncbi:MAG: hypothetical protein QM749_12080 [Aquabacterium sp.]